MNEQCTGDYIFNIDADEMPSEFLMKNIKTILAQNPEIELYWVPRINTVEGITEQHVRGWGWSINEKGWINYPDWQGRIFRNRPNIRWERPVHEMIVGFQTYAHLPMEQKYSIVHPKTIDRQMKQNQKYSEILT